MKEDRGEKFSNHAMGTAPTTAIDLERHLYMQDKMFPEWRKYWILQHKNGIFTYTRKP